MTCPYLFHGSLGQTAPLGHHPTPFTPTLRRLSSVLRCFASLVKVIPGSRHIDNALIIIQSVPSAADCCAAFTHDDAFDLALEKLDVLAVAHLLMLHVCVLVDGAACSTEVVELAHGVDAATHEAP